MLAMMRYNAVRQVRMLFQDSRPQDCLRSSIILRDLPHLHCIISRLIKEPARTGRTARLWLRPAAGQRALASQGPPPTARWARPQS